MPLHPPAPVGFPCAWGRRCFHKDSAVVNLMMLRESLLEGGLLSWLVMCDANGQHRELEHLENALWVPPKGGEQLWGGSAGCWVLALLTAPCAAPGAGGDEPGQPPARLPPLHLLQFPLHVAGEEGGRHSGVGGRRSALSASLQPRARPALLHHCRCLEPPHCPPAPCWEQLTRPPWGGSQPAFLRNTVTTECLCAGPLGC